MKNQQFIDYYKNQISYDLLLKFNYINIYEFPKVKKINLYTLKPKAKKKLILVYITKLLLLVNQFSYLSISKNKNNKYEINKIFVNLNTINSFLFLNKFINNFLPLVKNLKKFESSFFKNGNFSYKFNNIDLINNSMSSKINNFTQIINLKIMTTTKNPLVAQHLFNLLLFPLNKKKIKL